MGVIVRITAFAVALVAAAALPAAARVTRFELVSRSPLAGGAPFGTVGPYEKIVGRLWFTDRPDTAANRRVVDLERAPRDRSGEVESSADVVILAPRDAARANGSAIVDIPNRGNATALTLDGGRLDDVGDGFLMRHGFTVVAVGWQWDVPREPGLLGLRAPVATDAGAPITGLVRSDFHVDAPAAEHDVGDRGHTPYPIFARNDPANVLSERDDVLAPRRTIPRDRWRFVRDGNAIALDGNFVPGRIYELVYRARDPVVVGLGLAAIRDAVAFLKHDAHAPIHVARAYGFGISQSGRFLRTFVQRGFDADENGRPVFDAIIPIVSGPSLGSFDHRFAQPSRDAADFSSFFYPTDVPPFHEAEWPLPPGLKVIDVDTSHEYWGRTASLMTTSEDGTRDVALPENVRFYAIAGGMHIPNLAPTLRPGMRQRTDPLDYRWVERALLVRLDAWVRTGTPPPPSIYPTVAGGTLVAPEAWTFPAIPGLTPPTPIALHRTWRYDFGPRWSEGIDEREPPGIGAPYVTLVPKPDADGIDLGALRLPEIAVPLATYTGWNLRAPQTGFGDRLVDFFGSFVPFAPTRAARIAAGDPRLSIAERYPDRAAYLRAYDAATTALVRDGYVLAEDEPALRARAETLWKELAAP
ncbi:MAG TPA: alpha/beta hydrolase domain-containing protein [Candidatus Limnocylindria bacterium]|nr:alpha/beta hydrolase domain-containing protein [Candidatus Limnocylindria bacterium]